MIRNGSSTSGSPPRVRGKDSFRDRCDADMGITPAGAGKRIGCWLDALGMRDHPRGCGEKPQRGRPQEDEGGSPPRVRGKAPARARSSAALRITPAGAGKRPASPKSARTSGDHPRGCGEKSGLKDIMDRYTGSPPRVRGKGDSVIVGGHGSRITPAGAGKSPVSGHVRIDRRDHPRGCGEKTKRIPILGRFLLAAVQISFSFK